MWHDPWWLAAGIAVITVVAYLPAFWGGYIWDDPQHITENLVLRDLKGLELIWFKPGTTMQYYPMTFTTFWIEYQIWKTSAFGYHLVNVLLHAGNALLLWRVLHRLSIPGAWFIAAMFALHPVHVESVAWITERKNTLSGLFYLTALLAYLRFMTMRERTDADESEMRHGKSKKGQSKARVFTEAGHFYALSFLLFVLALLSKTVTCSLPAAIVLLIWWKQGRLGWRDLGPLVPMFMVGAALACHTVWVERHSIGADFDWTIPQRVLLAGRVVWEYASKLVWPFNLAFFYPKWSLDPQIWWRFAFAAGAVAVLVVLFLARGRIGRGPLVAVLFFGGTLVPALGFIDVYPMQFSYVADHFQYLASIGLLTLLGASAVTLGRRWPPVGERTGMIAVSLVLVVLGVLTWRQCLIYENEETLWRDTVVKNDGAVVAHLNLGNILSDRGRQITDLQQKVRTLEEAKVHLNRVLELRPDEVKARNGLGIILSGQRQYAEAIRHLSEALRIKPDYAIAHNTLGVTLFKSGQAAEGIDHLRKAIEYRAIPYPEAHYNLGVALLSQGDDQAAIRSFERAIRDHQILGRGPYRKAHLELAKVLGRTGDKARAVQHLKASGAVPKERLE